MPCFASVLLPFFAVHALGIPAVMVAAVAIVLRSRVLGESCRERRVAGSARLSGNTYADMACSWREGVSAARGLFVRVRFQLDPRSFLRECTT